MNLDVYATSRHKFGHEDDADDSPYYNENSRLVQITPRGMQAHHYDQTCSGSPLNFNMLNHDVYVDTKSDGGSGNSVLSFAWKVREVQKTTIQGGPIQDDDDAVDDDNDAGRGHDDNDEARGDDHGKSTTASGDDDVVRRRRALRGGGGSGGGGGGGRNGGQSDDGGARGGGGDDGRDDGDDGGDGHHHDDNRHDDDDGDDNYKQQEVTHWMGSQLVRWDRSSDTLTTELDMWELANPNMGDAYLFPSSEWNDETATCSGNGSWAVINTTVYHHMSSVSIGPYENYVMSSKNLNTIWSVDAKAPHNKQWMLSTSLPGSDYAFKSGGEDDEDLSANFYAPHTVSQLANGNLLFVDDGAGRSGCGVSFDDDDVGDQKGCFSRAVMYALDDDRNEAKIAWEFAWPYPLSATASKEEWKLAEEHDMFNSVGGSVYLLRDDSTSIDSRSGDYGSRFLVGFTSVETNRHYNSNGDMWLFEVDESGVATCAMSTPAVGAPGEMQGYRFKPWKSIGGEGEVCPHHVLGGSACSTHYSYDYQGAGGGPADDADDDPLPPPHYKADDTNDDGCGDDDDDELGPCGVWNATGGNLNSGANGLNNGGAADDDYGGPNRRDNNGNSSAVDSADDDVV